MVQQIIKLRPQDKKKLGTKFNFVVRTPGGGVRGFKTLGQVNKSLGLSGMNKFKSSSFKGLKPATK